MKRLVVLLVSLSLSLVASAQLTITGGLTTTTGKISESVKTDNFSQFHIGVGYCLEFSSGLSIVPSLMYNVKGMSFDELKSMDFRFKERTGYLELPIQFQLHIPLIPDIVELMAIGEPFVSYAVNRSLSEGGPWEKVIDWGDAKRFRYGLGFGVGVEVFEHVQVTARYIWDFAGSEFSGNGVFRQLKDQKSSGLKVSAALVF